MKLVDILYVPQDENVASNNINKMNSFFITVRV